jgi:hypothetical protein
MEFKFRNTILGGKGLFKITRYVSYVNYVFSVAGIFIRYFTPYLLIRKLIGSERMMGQEESDLTLLDIKYIDYLNLGD